MNLKDLNSIDIKDLKNIDLTEVKSRIQSQPGLLIIILMAFVTIAVLYSSFNGYTTATKSSKIQTAELQERLAAIEKLEGSQKLHASFVKEAPKAIAADQLIQTLSEFAFQRNVEILSFSPVQEKNNKYVNLTSVQVNIRSEDYASIILFVHDIEKSSHPIRIKNWSATSITPNKTPQRRSRRSTRPSGIKDEDDMKEYIKTTITIESVELKNV
jgi:hypothetical protein